METENGISESEKFKFSYFSCRGRINCRRYWMYYMLPLLGVLAVLYIFVLTVCLVDYNPPPVSDAPLNEADFGDFPFFWIFPFFAVFFFFFYLSIVAAIKRLHDMNMSGWFALLLLFSGNLISIFLGCIPTNEKPSRFGPPDPY